MKLTMKLKMDIVIFLKKYKSLESKVLCTRHKSIVSSEVLQTYRSRAI